MEEGWLLSLGEYAIMFALFMLPMAAALLAVYSELKDKKTREQIRLWIRPILDQSTIEHLERMEMQEARMLDYTFEIGPAITIYCLDEPSREPVHNWRKEGF